MKVATYIRTLLILACCWYPVAHADEAGPSEVVQKAANEVIAILKKEGDSIRNDSRKIYELANEHILPLFDFDKMSLFVLGKIWNEASTQQQTDFQREFKALLINTYATALSGFKTDEEIAYQEVKFSPKNENIAIVPTEIRRKGAGPIAVVYRMIRTDANWRIYDVVIDGVSLVTNYRANFASKVRKNGLDGLISSLSEHNKPQSKVETTNATIQPAASKTQ